MNPAFKLTEGLVLEKIFQGQTTLRRSNKIGSVLIATTALLFCLGIGFFMYAGYVHMHQIYPAPEAAMMTGGLVLVLSCAFGIGAYSFYQYRRSRIKRFKRDAIKTMHDLSALVDEEFGKAIQDNPKTSLLISTLAGYVVGETFIR